MKKNLSWLLSLLLALALMLGGAAYAETAEDDPYWPQSMYDHVEETILQNAPRVKDADGAYIYETVDGVFTYTVKLTDYEPHLSIEDVYTAHPYGTGSILTRTEVEDWTWAFRAALQDVADNGGGTVVVPAGTYVTGAIRYRGDNTRIHLEDGANIQFIRNLQYGTNERTEPTTMLPPVTPEEGEWDDWYPMEKTRYECRDLYGFSPLIYAYGLRNIALTGAGHGGENAITGDGRAATHEADIDGNDFPDGYIEPEAGAALSIIDGMADAYHMRTFGLKLPVYAEDGVTVLIPEGTKISFNIDPETMEPVLEGNGGVSYKNWITNLMNAWEPIEVRKIPDLVPVDTEGLSDAQRVARNALRINQYRPTFIEPHECENVLISDFYLRNSPFWELHPTYCQNVIVRGLHINSHGGNNDGCDPDSSQYVLIEDNIFNTGDDCIAIKCGRDNDGYQPWNMPSTHMIVRNNLMKDGHGGMVSGSEMGGGVEWIFSHDNIYDSPNVDMGNESTIRAGVITLNKVEVVLRNALFTDDQDFVFYSALPRVIGTRIDAQENTLVMTYDRAITQGYLDRLAQLSVSLSADGAALPIEAEGVWREDGASISYKILTPVDPQQYHTVDTFDPTSQVMSYSNRIDNAARRCLLNKTKPFY